jgi:hypothetical protein
MNGLGWASHPGSVVYEGQENDPVILPSAGCATVVARPCQPVVSTTGREKEVIATQDDGMNRSSTGASCRGGFSVVDARLSDIAAT